VTRPLGAAWGNETILVVDDQPGIRTLAQRVLVRGGYAVLLAEHGEEARAVAKAHDGPIHLILMDVQLPGERGPRVVADLLRKYPAARVAFISGHNDLGEEPDLPKGPYSFLRKPFGPDQLLMTVRSALDAKPSGLDGTPRSVAAGGPSS
jgi:DNA-binding NtrC family response regulator